MDRFITGFILGAVIFGCSAWAASRYITLQDSTGVVINSDNPLPVQVY